MPDGQDQQVAKLLWDGIKAQAKGVADMRGLAPNNKKLTPEEELTLYNQTAPGWSPEQEAMLLLSGKSREEVGMMKYPHREKIAKSGGRALSKYEQAKYHATMAQKIDPTWTPVVTKAQAPPLPPGLDPTAEPTAPDPLSETAGGFSLEG